MTERDTIIAGLKAALPSLRHDFPIHALGVFGSLARGDATAASDIDVLVEFEHPVSLSAFLALEERLAAIAGRDVDLVTRDALKPYMGRSVMRDLISL